MPASAAAFASSVSSARVTTICGSTTPVASGSRGRVKRSSVSFTGASWASRAVITGLRVENGSDRPFIPEPDALEWVVDPEGRRERGSEMARRVVVWGTGFVGRMVIPEILRHPTFELVGVGVSNPAKVGRDVGEICGLDPTGLAATDDVQAL